VWIKDSYEQAKALLLQCPCIAEADKTAICNMVDKLLATRIKKRRAEKYYSFNRHIIERGWLSSFHNVTEQQLYRCLAKIQQLEVATETKRDYKIVIKRMLEYLDNPLYKQIRTSSHNHMNRLPRYYLTVFDVLKMVKSEHPHLRDKAMAACLYESGCRPHEFFMLRERDVRFECIPVKIKDIKTSLEVARLNINPECKTGARSPPLIFTVPWLKAWMKNSESKEYLWTEIRGVNKGRLISYSAARKAIKLLALNAGLDASRVSLYSFRHGRNTEVSRILSYAEQCEYAGWIQGSDMPRIYNHLSGMDMIEPLLSKYGISVVKKQDDKQAWLQIFKEGLKEWSKKPEQ